MIYRIFFACHMHGKTLQHTTVSRTAVRETEVSRHDGSPNARVPRKAPRTLQHLLYRGILAVPHYAKCRDLLSQTI